MKSDYTNYRDLELISDDDWNAAHSKSTLKGWLQSALTVIAKIFAANSEPKIWTSYDRFGTKHWHLYDLSISQTFTFSSEHEILSWLDQRYYH